MRYNEARIKNTQEMRGQTKAPVETVVEKPPLRLSQICAYARPIEARVSQVCAYAHDRVKQGLGLRGSNNWDKSAKREDGDFLSLLDFLSSYSPELKSHVHNSPQNARYLSPKIQNEFITINGDMIRKSIVDECNSSLFFGA